ncbi:hypothetical protein GCM10009863_10650 [Streptomyces axinellae]|uniref:Uncharacterized protein n=1 Tax=Streptomyces axinellae TaxID=552788 RepID=A0ABP6C2Q4_9ACTN
MSETDVGRDRGEGVRGKRPPPPASPADEATAELAALAEARAFWRLAPAWVPRAGYAQPTPALLREVESGLMRRLRG